MARGQQLAALSSGLGGKLSDPATPARRVVVTVRSVALAEKFTVIDMSQVARMPTTDAEIAREVDNLYPEFGGT